MRALAKALLAVAGLAAVAPPALAHQASDAFVQWTVDGAQVHQRLEIALRDLDRDLALDADGDGLLRWGEVRRRWADIERTAADGVRLQRAGRDCRVLDAAAPLLDARDDTAFAVLRQTLDCGGPVGTLTVAYTLFAQSDPTHRGLARIGAESGPVHVLVPGHGAPLTLAGDAMARDAAGAMPDAPARFLAFLLEGARHIAAGADHVLFIAVLVLAAVWRRDGRHWVPREQPRTAWHETVKLVTAFTLAHSVTLGLAAAGVLSPPTRWVESLIALTVLLTALDNLRPFVPGPRWLAVGVFGLAHGFGFAGPLQALGLRGGELVLPLLAFNLGVELAQLALVALLLPLALAVRARPAYRRWVVRPASAGVALLALGWTVQRAILG